MISFDPVTISDYVQTVGSWYIIFILLNNRTPPFCQNNDNSSLNLILPPDARYLPHGEKHSEVITPLCPAIVRTQCPFSTSNNLTILSDDPVAM